MVVCLISAPTVAEFEEAAEAESEQVRESAGELQLGVMSLAAVLQSNGCPVKLIDLNHQYYRYLSVRESCEEFCTWASKLIASESADVYGFSSICSSYPLSIRLACDVKALRPDSTIIFGGPQASVVDAETLLTFPFVDLIVRGEAERTFPALLDELSGRKRFDNLAGLTFRDGNHIVRNPNASVIEDLDSLPTPAYELAENLHELNFASLELGRGCPFACKFCSTNDFFRRRFRVKSPRRMLDEMRSIARKFGFRRFDLVHDMFTVDRRRVVSFCNELLSSGEKFKWSCSARTDCVDTELLELMAQAGCIGIFFGVETGSARMQAVIDKHLDIPQAKAAIDAAEGYGIATTVSLITGFPEENVADLRDTASLYMHAVRTPNATPQLNLLAPLAATPIHRQHVEELTLDDLCSDISHQGRFQNVVDRLLIQTHRDIFPNFYLLPTPYLDREYVLELREFLLMATARVRWLLAALDASTSGILDVFSEWRSYRVEHRCGLTGGDLRHYYRLRTFREDFINFLRSHVRDWSSLSVRALFEYEVALQQAIREHETLPRVAGCERVQAPFERQDRPQRNARVYSFELEWDIQAVLNHVRRREEPDERVRRHGFYATRPISKESTRLVEIAPLGAFVLNLCTGVATIEQIIEQFATTFETQESLPPDLVCISLLEELSKRGFLAIYRSLGSATMSPHSEAVECRALSFAGC
ncbi:MAG: radical SAM protein [Acidobacteriaceae bacterium]|nr:radical SAM protein [Acidobacteriaceae bacterium]